jgi:hypothetical protein
LDAASNNSEFVGLVAGSWVGTSIEQSAILGPLIREVLASGKMVTFAVKHNAAKPDHIDVLEDEAHDEAISTSAKCSDDTVPLEYLYV